MMRINTRSDLFSGPFFGYSFGEAKKE